MTALTTIDVAAKFETTPRTLRKFLRADARANDRGDTLPGKGSRYALESKTLPAMRKRFLKWQEAEAKARAERAARAAEDAAQAVTEGDDAEVEGDTPEVETEGTDA